MTDKELDDLFTNAFANHEIPVRGDMWQRVQPKKKRRSAIIWWPVAGLVMAVVVCATIRMNQYHISLKNKATSSSLSQKNEETKASHATPAEQPLLSEKINPAKDAKTKDSLLNNTATVLKNNNNRHHNQVYSKSTKIKMKIIDSSTNSMTAKKDVEANKLINQPDKINEFTKGGKQADANNMMPDTSLFIKTDSVTTTIKNENIKSGNQADKSVSASVIINKKDTKKSEIEFMIAGYVSGRHVYDIDKTMAPAFVPGIVNPKTKSSVGGFSVNVRLSEPVGKHLFFKTGLQFLQTRQSIIYTQPSVTRYAFVSTLTANVVDTMRYSQISLQRPLVKSVYNNISIPLLIDYQTDVSKIKIGATAGAMVNFISWYHGDVPDGDYSKTLKASNTFKWNNGVSLYAGLHVGKQFGNWQLFAEPHLQYALFSITKSSASFRQKINSYGVGIGIKKRIGK